jgi:hypothetical protein
VKRERAGLLGDTSLTTTLEELGDAIKKNSERFEISLDWLR